MPDLTVDELTLALAVVAGVALLGFLLVIILAFRLRRLRKNYALLREDGGGARDLVGTLGEWSKKLQAMDARMDDVAAGQEGLRQLARAAIQRFHLVRYDAFEDMGGRLSFSAALLDDHGDGVVISSINGRTETRTYAKPIKNYSSEHNLSEEEGEAIAGAVGRSDRQATSL